MKSDWGRSENTPTFLTLFGKRDTGLTLDIVKHYRKNGVGFGEEGRNKEK